MSHTALKLPRLGTYRVKDGTITNKIVAACNMTAEVMAYPCLTNFLLLANLKRLVNRIIRMAISNNRAMSEVHGASVPKNPVIF